MGIFFGIHKLLTKISRTQIFTKFNFVLKKGANIEHYSCDLVSNSQHCNTGLLGLLIITSLATK